MKVSPAIEDAFIPMEIDASEALREQKRKRNEHWLRMRKAREYWMTEYKIQALDDTFWRWLENNYGLRPCRDDFDNITEDYSIIDEKLYTLFLLKFGQ